MLEKLIRPVASEACAVRGESTTIFGKVFIFPDSLGPELDIDITNSFLSHEAVINIHEVNQEIEIMLLINIHPYLGNPNFVGADIMSKTGDSLESHNKKVLYLPDNHPMSLEYTTESPKPRKLRLVEGVNYNLVIGQKTKNVFVDGWLRETQAPKWRISIPSERKGRYNIPALLVPDSKLLLFE